MPGVPGVVRHPDLMPSVSCAPVIHCPSRSGLISPMPQPAPPRAHVVDSGPRCSVGGESGISSFVPPTQLVVSVLMDVVCSLIECFAIDVYLKIL